MERKRLRVFAYSMVKVIESSDLSDIPGGGMTTNHQFFRPTGAGDLRDIDAALDL